MAEKNILAYFNSPEQAESVKRKLEALRVVDISIDRFDGYPGEGVQRIMNPLTGDFASLANLTLGADVSDRNAGILAATEVDASGMSAGGKEELFGGKDILLTAVVPEETFHQALQVVKESGGQL